MNASPKLASTVHIEVAGDQAAPILLTGSLLPADWSHTFSTVRDNQNTIDVHLLIGSSYTASENNSIGLWRISGIPPAERGALDIQVDVHVNSQGKVELTAVHDNQPLSVFRMPGGSGQAAVVISETGHQPVDAIDQVIQTGNQEDAGAGPDDISPQEPPNAAAPKATIDDSKVNLRCEQCGSQMEVRFVGDMHDKRLVCDYCGAEMDLPDTYQRIARKRVQKSKPWGNSSTDTVHIETRSDHLADGHPLEPIPKIDDLRKLIEEGGLEDIGDETLEILKKYGFKVSLEGKSSIVSMIHRLEKQNIDWKSEHSGDYIPLTPREILELAGDPLPPEERLNCPNCDAVISRKARQCPWCSVSLSEYEEE